MFDARVAVVAMNMEKPLIFGLVAADAEGFDLPVLVMLILTQKTFNVFNALSLDSAFFFESRMSHESQKCLLFRLRKSRMSLNQFIVLRGAISSHCYNGGSFVGEKSYEDRHESSIYGSRLLIHRRGDIEADTYGAVLDNT